MTQFFENHQAMALVIMTVGVKCTERRLEEVMPVFERPYLRKEFHPATTWREIFRSCSRAYEL